MENVSIDHPFISHNFFHQERLELVGHCKCENTVKMIVVT